MLSSLVTEPKPKSELWNEAKLGEETRHCTAVCPQNRRRSQDRWRVSQRCSPPPPPNTTTTTILIPPSTSNSWVKGKSLQKQMGWVDHITTYHESTVHTMHSLNDCENLFKVTSTHIQCGLVHRQLWTFWRADTVFLCPGLSARTYFNWISHVTHLKLGPRNNYVLYCRGGRNRNWGVEPRHRDWVPWASYTLPNDNSSLLTPGAMTGHTKLIGSPTCWLRVREH